jgi:hypothetical protein
VRRPPIVFQRSTDEQGTLHIGNAPPTSQEKGGELKAEGKTGEVKAPAKQVAPEPEPPRLNPLSSRRPYGPDAEARRKAILETRQSAPPSPEAPGRAKPPAQPESPSSHKSP